ncbi:hypothetical protein CYD82_06435 [Klebsiella pneumoniae]|uniref:hypothetical protein n=1 Tax=Klebsiella pneumoniae TaxID=573 RepID=UPI000C6EA001|nr:hypothetical protein [Klebsiella pneumoniae]PKT16047.1 hypothetical protein CYD82_06435 [Klebsiella pneumoniae]
MGILGKFGNFLEKSGVSVFSKETLKLLTEMNDQGVYQSSLAAVDFALSMRNEEHFETFVLSRILLEPYQSSNDERMTLYRIMQDNYGQGLKMFKKSLAFAKQYGGEDIVKGEFNFKLMAFRIIMFNLAYNSKLIDFDIASKFYETLWRSTKGDTPDNAIDDFIQREKLMVSIGLSDPTTNQKKEDYQFYMNVISLWANRGIMNI